MWTVHHPLVGNQQRGVILLRFDYVLFALLLKKKTISEGRN